MSRAIGFSDYIEALPARIGYELHTEATVTLLNERGEVDCRRGTARRDRRPDGDRRRGPQVRDECQRAAQTVAANGVTGIDANGVLGIDANGATGIDANGATGIDANGVTGIDANGVTGIDANGVLGIDANGATGIDANGATGIDANGVLGIDANGVTGIDANGVLGIDANGVTGIDANGVLGIDANGATGIDANGATGIDANGVTGIDANGVLGIDANGVQGILAGPVDSIDRINGVFESMGQVVMASQTMLAGMRVGDYVSVSGSVVSSGWLYADSVSVSADRYVPGATEVFVTGLLSSVNREMGTARIGGLTIDYTASLGSSSAPSGAIWSFSGIRPAQRGVMLSDRSGVSQ